MNRFAEPDTPEESTVDIQINNVDFYQGFPTALDRLFNAATRQRYVNVPLIRVYGSTSTGQNVMVHVHGVYPYLYIPYEGNVSDGKLSSLYSFGPSD